ncbi:hypothetical protein FDB55_14595 [Clostridium botulinum]|uniref:Uncharacterized protein n=1 Tax=Clostridium botulinum TaxID=1491 RepID=A0A0L9Y522_CLOBO|nr:hypothetical protein [Clostridium botulinum]KAI3345231.1 hypothetical protein CIT18_16070 [Clostridium botulinum]KOM86826.1 hypothetical protein ACP51_14445 [Clostridium botulinum]KOR60473.1 hypothetical protein ADT22_08395 [Clostridium botulinum]MBN1048999.1 hypothetical protein [Clostridium botulinum]MCS6109948.1 hypothetical protein [Clostridium botulinum]
MEKELKLESNEKLIATIKCHTKIDKLTQAKGLMINIFIFPIAGVCNEYRLTVTDKNIYLEQLSYTIWGGLYDVVHMDKINLENIKKFEVDILEDNKELIIIGDYEDKYIKLINDNLNGENIATEVSEILNIH